jgi:hypothetical protein
MVASLQKEYCMGQDEDNTYKPCDEIDHGCSLLRLKCECGIENMY